MAIAHRASTSGDSGTGTATSIVVGKPAGVASDDVLLVGLSIDGATAVTPPTGWTAIAVQQRGSTAHRSFTFVRVAAGSEPADYTFTLDVASQFAWGCSAYTGVDGTTPQDAAVKTNHFGATLTPATSSLTTVTDDALLVALFSARGTGGATSTWTPPTGFTERVDDTPTGSGATAGLSMHDMGAGAAGSKGPFSATQTTSLAGTTQLIALRPASGPIIPEGAGVLSAGSQAIGAGSKAGRGSGSLSGALSAIGAGIKRAAGSGRLSAGMTATGSGQEGETEFKSGSGVLSAAAQLLGLGRKSASGSGRLSGGFGTRGAGSGDVEDRILLTIDGLDRTDDLLAGTFDITERGHPGASTCSASLWDPDSAIDIPDNAIARATHLGVELFEGPVRRTDSTDHGPGTSGRVLAFTAQGYTVLLDDDPVIGTQITLAGQTDAAIVEWLVETFGTKGVTVGSEVATTFTGMPSIDFTGLSLTAALGKVGEITGATFYVDSDLRLHYFVTEALAAPFHLSDDPDGSTTMGYSTLSVPRDTTDAPDAVYFTGDGVEGWYPDPPPADRRARAIRDDSIKTAADIEDRGAAYLASHGVKEDGKVVLFEPGLRAGMEVQITSERHNLDAKPVSLTQVSITVDEAGYPTYSCDFGARPLDLAAQFGSTSGVAGRALGMAVDTRQRVIDLTIAGIGGANQLPNSSFEKAALEGWSVFGTWVFGFEVADAFDGAKVARYSGSSSTHAITSPFVAVDRSADYWLSVWSFMRAIGSGSAIVRVDEYTSSGFIQGTVIGIITAAESGWTRHSARFGPNEQLGRREWHADTERIRLFIKVDGTDLTWDIDGVQVERGAMLTAYARTPGELLDQSVGATQIADNAVTTPKLIANAVVTGKIASGVSVTGMLVISNASGTVIIDGTSDMFRIIATGTGTVAGPNGSSGSVASTVNNITVATGLTYPPAYLTYVETGGGVAQQIPAVVSFVTDGTPQITFVTSVSVVNGNQTRHQVSCYATANLSGDPDIPYRYYIHEQVAL